MMNAYPCVYISACVTKEPTWFQNKPNVYHQNTSDCRGPDLVPKMKRQSSFNNGRELCRRHTIAAHESRPKSYEPVFLFLFSSMSLVCYRSRQKANETTTFRVFLAIARIKRTQKRLADLTCALVFPLLLPYDDQV